MLNITYPIENGIVNKWEDLEKIWDHCFETELKVDPAQHKCLLTEPILMSNIISYRERATELMFEKYKVPGFALGIQAILSLYSIG